MGGLPRDGGNPTSVILWRVLKVLKFLSILYLFFVSIELFGDSFKLFGTDSAASALRVTDNPMVGLLFGVLGTSLVQSSSTTTSVIVGMVATGVLRVDQAVPMIMGANIGTTITNTIVSIGHLRHREEFNRAFAGAVVHDFFNMCAVAVLLPIELLFRPIERGATWITSQLLGFEGAAFASPLKLIVQPVVKLVHAAGEWLLPSPVALGIVLAVLSLVLLIFALTRMVKIMRGALASRMELLVDKVLFKSTGRALTVGVLLTVAVQSSSVTTSLAIPLIGAGVVKLEKAYPYMVGANLGTTVTAMLASFVTGNPAAVTIALCHLLFNLAGTAIFLPLRALPLYLARGFGRMAARRRWAALVYILVLFFGLPGLFVFL
jgi:solute carrier family 34 (sodium-dependent phosphate cotransporter)